MQTILDLKEITCANCENLFGVPAHIIARRKQDGNTFYCPLGHGNVYRDNEFDRIKKENKRLKDEQYWSQKAQENLANDLKEVKQEKANVKRQLTITRKRVSNGVCPCCNRTFKQLAAHMNSKHPEFVKAVN